MMTVAREAGVSKNTVSLALRHDPQIPESTRVRIEKIAERLGYARSPVVSQLMTELRKAHPAGYRRTLALLNANQDRDAFTKHPTVPSYVEGCRRRASHHGYGLDTFWLHDPALNGDRLNSILRARGIRGALVVGLMNENRLPERFNPTWQEHAAVVTGVRTRNPTLSFACVDHHALVIEAVEQARKLGYQRPGLVVDEHIDRLVEGRFSSGFWIGQQALPVRDRLPGFFAVDAAREKPELFRTWFERHRPDVILTLYHSVRRWVEAAGAVVPRDVGLIQLERRTSRPEWAGMDQHNDQAGEAAVDLLVGMLHSHEHGLPPFPKATLIGASWIAGATVRSASLPLPAPAKV